MRRRTEQFLAQCAVTIATLMFSLILPASAQTANVLHDFGVAASDGNLPSGPLLKDAAGNLYGVTSAGGAHNFGTVYRLSPISTGGFTETILYNFKGGSGDGALPEGPLLRDSAGNLYGSTEAGGIRATGCNNVTVNNLGCGVVFKLTPTASGPWTETVLHRFTGTDGGNSFSGLVRDSKGNFYGATAVGGSKGLGTVYELNLTATGWKETVLHSFTGSPDGAQPLIFQTRLTLDGLGNIYGSTYGGGSSTTGAGIVFELSPPKTTGAWTEKILYTFQGGADGSQPATGVILDKSGNVYGTTFRGGTSIGDGIVFKLSAANGFAKTVLHDFNSLTDPARATPHGLILDVSGDIYGTTEYALYKLTPGTSGFSETVLWEADSSGANTIYAPAMRDAQGIFWGTTLWGGTAGSTTGGIAWKIIP
jgi:uncharacterized repeat protein (TIGR03803 family)